MKHLFIMLAIMAAIVYVFFFMDLGLDSTYKYTFQSEGVKVSSVLIPLDKLNKELPTDWEDYEYMVLEMRTSTAQRFLLGIETDSQVYEKRMHLMPQAWVRVSIPLTYYREKPKPGADLAATVNKPLKVGFMHIEGGAVGPLTNVKGLSIKYYTPLDDPEIEIKSLTLSKEDMGNAYLDTIPYIDRFGQWTRSDFEGKVYSEEELRAAWAKEDSVLALGNTPYSASIYGGFAAVAPREATGFFRVEKIDGIWWFVDPEGYQFLSVGVNGLSTGGGGNQSRDEALANLYEESTTEIAAQGGMPQPGDRPQQQGAPQQGAPQQGGAMPQQQGGRANRGGFGGFGGSSFGMKNQQLRYGSDNTWRDKWAALTLQRMNAWGLNTGGNSKPYMSYMTARTSTVAGLPDVYGEGFAEQVENSLRNMFESNKDNPLIIGYFSGNEPSWLEQEERVCSLILEADDCPMKQALQAYLQDGDTPERRKAFVYQTFRTYLETIKAVKDKYDPNHLNLGIRFGHANPPADEILQICKDLFDVYSFNTYRLAPNRAYMDTVYAKTGLPMILGEFHFGTIDRGMAPGLVQVANQQERAVAYQYFSEQAFSHPALIGTSWFQYTDQGLTGRNDGERYNIGMVDVTDQPYPLTQGIAKTASRMYDVHNGKLQPTDQKPLGVQGNEDDLSSSSNQ